ncbi:MAG: TetR/AcrR family transcriptional regulator C-terminal domain-containing protein, partial [Rhizobiaceae bacterium]
KEDLFRAILRQHVERMSAAAYLRTSGKTDLAAGLKAYANRALAYSLEGDYLAINRLVYSASHQFPEIGMASSEGTLFGIEQIAEFIEQCAKEDGMPCRDSRVPAEMFTMLMRGWHGCVMLSNRTVSEKERKRWVEAMVDGLIAGRQGW